MAQNGLGIPTFFVFALDARLSQVIKGGRRRSYDATMWVLFIYILLDMNMLSYGIAC